MWCPACATAPANSLASCSLPVVLRLRGGKRGRNSIVVGKKAHQKRKSAWTHFTGGETFGVDAPAEPAWQTARERKDGKSPDQHDLERMQVALVTLNIACATPPDEITMRQSLRVGETARQVGRAKGSRRTTQKGGKAHSASLHAIVCGELNRLGVDSVMELGCDVGHLIVRMNAK